MHETLTDVLRQVLATPAAPKQEGQQRGVPRYPMRARVAIQPMNGDRPEGRPIKVWMRDISSTGVGFTDVNPCRKGQTFLLHVPDLDDLSPLRCVVVRCERMSGDVYIIGASFTAPPGTPQPFALNLPAPSLTTLPSATITRLTAHVAARGNTATAPDAAAALATQVRGAAADSATPTALVALDRQIVWANQAMHELLGLRPGELASRSFASLAYADAPGFDSDTPPRRASTTYAHRDGSGVHVEQSVNALRDVAGRALFLLVVAEPAALPEIAPSAPVVAATPSRVATPPPPTTPSASPESEAERIRRAMFD